MVLSCLPCFNSLVVDCLCAAIASVAIGSVVVDDDDDDLKYIIKLEFAVLCIANWVSSVHRDTHRCFGNWENCHEYDWKDCFSRLLLCREGTSEQVRRRRRTSFYSSWPFKIDVPPPSFRPRKNIIFKYAKFLPLCCDFLFEVGIFSFPLSSCWLWELCVCCRQSISDCGSGGGGINYRQILSFFRRCLILKMALPVLSLPETAAAAARSQLPVLV